MKNKNIFLKDTTAVISGAFSAFANIKNEIDIIIKSRLDKFINSQNLVNREDFEALEDRHEKLLAEFNLLKAKFNRKNSK